MTRGEAIAQLTKALDDEIPAYQPRAGMLVILGLGVWKNVQPLDIIQGMRVVLDTDLEAPEPGTDPFMVITG